MKIFIIAALSADGFIAKDPKEPSTAWTSLADKKYFGEITKRAGVVVMGANTFTTIGKALPGRRTIVYSPEPINVPGVETTTLPPKELAEKLENEGVKELAVCGGQTIYTMFMQSGAVSELYLTIEPVVFGSGISLFREPVNAKLELVSVDKKDQSIFLEYQTLKN
jgi:dihydrofolate reductase